ncbi:hypothetical protein HanPI659440_Chr02g0092281 [Helianthus annuus]|nr:hypothetical protein HanPI659440_Chr02g0092281 [Helianthus annuus]
MLLPIFLYNENSSSCIPSESSSSLIPYRCSKSCIGVAEITLDNGLYSDGLFSLETDLGTVFTRPNEQDVNVLDVKDLKLYKNIVITGAVKQIEDAIQQVCVSCNLSWAHVRISTNEIQTGQLMALKIVRHINGTPGEDFASYDAFCTHFLLRVMSLF